MMEMIGEAPAAISIIAAPSAYFHKILDDITQLSSECARQRILTARKEYPITCHFGLCCRPHAGPFILPAPAFKREIAA